MRLTLHARIEIGLAAALLLGSCGENTPRSFTKADSEMLDIVMGIADNNTNRIIAIDNRIDRVELRLEKIEARLGN